MLLLKGPKYFKGLMWSKWHIEMPNPKGWPQSPQQCSTKYLVTYASWLLGIIIAAKKWSPLQVEPGKPGAEVSKREKPKNAYKILKPPTPAPCPVASPLTKAQVMSFPVMYLGKKNKQLGGNACDWREKCCVLFFLHFHGQWYSLYIYILWSVEVVLDKMIKAMSSCGFASQM